jgi:peptide/nickel transport system substrate-binding protein
MAQFEIFVKPGTPMDNAAVRTAVLTAINPRLWMEEVFGPYAELSQSLFQNAMLTASQPVQFPTDFAAARAAIDEHGPVELVIGLQAEIATYAPLAELLAAQLGTIGVKATVQVLPIGAGYAMKGDPKAPDLLLTIASPDAAHPENQAKTYFVADGAVNYYGRSLPEAEALIDEAGLITDIPRRDAIYEQASRIYVDAGYFIPLVDIEDIVVHAKGLIDLGLRPAFPQGNIDFGTVRWAE